MIDLRVTTIQSELFWTAPEKNRAAFAERLKDLAGQTDLIILPEMFTTGFYMEAADLAEPANGLTIEWMRAMAVQSQSAIMGSIICADNGQYYNRLLLVESGGKIHSYDKRHLFAFAGEDNHYSPGQSRCMVDLNGWRICPLVCYDLRFPVWSRNIDPYYDLLVYVANWPTARRKAWTKLLQARAIENQSYVIGVNRIGKDGNNVEYAGDTCVIDFHGEALFEANEFEYSIETTTLVYADLQTYRFRFPFLESADTFKLLKE